MNIDDILDNIAQYRDDINSLILHLKSLGIYSFEAFKAAAREAGVPIPKPIQDALAKKFLSSDDDDWAKAQATNTAEAYDEYLFSHEDGNFREEARNAKMRLAQELDDSNSADEWQSLDKNSIESLQRFIKQYPKGTHSAEAARLLRELRKEQYEGIDIKALSKQIKEIQTNKLITRKAEPIYEKIVSYINTGKITKGDLLKAIKDDHNFISSKVANLLWENDIINDFSEADIDADFIACMMSNVQVEAFAPSQPLTSITKKPCTEVYFWGIPSSGKSCALGAIMSAANDGYTATCMLRDPDCKGYGYMNRLSELFKSNGEVCPLPEGTPETSTYEMGFELVDEKKLIHPITCIDLAGELVRCMYKNDAGEEMSDQQREVLQTLTNIMVDNRTSNRKLHFFVLEYGAEDRKYEGLPQSTYLQAAVAYINRTGIFKKDTDGLYLIITKVDKAGLKGKELQQHLEEYIGRTYQGFYNGLKQICETNEINDGKVTIIPFTLGDVCFQNYCKFNSQTASTVVKTIMERTYGYKNNKWERIKGKLKG